MTLPFHRQSTTPHTVTMVSPTTPCTRPMASLFLGTNARDCRVTFLPPPRHREPTISARPHLGVDMQRSSRISTIHESLARHLNSVDAITMFNNYEAAPGDRSIVLAQTTHANTSIGRHSSICGRIYAALDGATPSIVTTVLIDI